MSMIGDHFQERWPQYASNTFVYPPPITREEFDALKAEVELMKGLLKRAKLYDEEHGEPDCEMDEKLALLRRVAELVGVDLEDVLRVTCPSTGSDPAVFGCIGDDEPHVHESGPDGCWFCPSCDAGLLTACTCPDVPSGPCPVGGPHVFQRLDPRDADTWGRTGLACCECGAAPKDGAS